MRSFDVVIAGGGMVGLALACGLQGNGLRIAVIESHPLNVASPLPQASQLRVSAINTASERLLRRLDVWDDIVALRAAPYQAMSVWERDSFARIHFQAEQSGYNHLGHIIENDVICRALWAKAESSSDIVLFTPAALQQVVRGENDAFITLDNGEMLTGRLLVGADGAHSWLRRQADIPLTYWDYGHHALVATIRTQHPHAATARQVFHSDGILAFLPLSDPHLCSIVWSLPPADAERLVSCEESRFEQELAMIFDAALGHCMLESERQVFPLTGRYARNFATHRVVLAGDAAHTIHPLAGQGVNLGFMDVAELIGELRRLQREGKDLGQHLYLRRYERRRKQSAALMLAGMQGFRVLFAGQDPSKKLFRDVGLVLADKLPGVKQHFMRQAMGIHDLPAWLSES